MIRCSNCNNVLEDDARFCDVCGHPVAQTLVQTVEEIKPAGRICPFCGTELDADDVFCAGCGKRVDDVPAEKEVYVSEAVPAVETEPFVPDSIPEPAPEPIPEPAPQPDVSAASSVQASNDIPHPVNSSNPPEKNNKSKDKLIKGFGIALGITAVVIVFLVFMLLITGNKSAGNGKDFPEYCFYLKDNELYTLDNNKSKLVTSKLFEDEDDSLSSLCLYRNGNKVLYVDHLDDVSDTGTLNLVNMNKKDGKLKIDSDVFPYTYLTNSDFSAIVYSKDDAGYQYDVRKKDKQKFPQNAYPVAFNKKMTDYLLMDDEDRLYVKFGKKDKEKIADDVSVIYARRTEFSSKSLLLYTEYDSDEETYSLYSYKKGVKNYLLDSDEVGVILYKGETGYIAAVDCEDDTVEIYYYDGKTLTDVITATDAVGFMSNYGDSDKPMYVVVDEDGDYYLLIEGTKTYLSSIDEKEILHKVIFSKDGSRVLFVTYDEEDDPAEANTAYLCDIQKKGKSYTLKPAKTIYDINYNSAYFDSRNKLVYLQDWDSDNLNGDLYQENKHIASDVYSLIYANGNNRSDIYYLTDYDKKTGSDAVTLNYSNGSRNKVVSTDVRERSIIIGEDAVYYLYDYSQKHGYGDLYCFKKNRTNKIDTDVEDACLSVTSLEDVYYIY